MSESKTHYRKVFKSDHLGSADLEEMIEEGKSLVFTIKEVRQEKGTRVAGKKIDANIAYFNEKIKPLVLNATNSKALKLISQSPFIEDWTGVSVELYVQSDIRFGNDVVDGVRLKQANIFESMKNEIISILDNNDLDIEAEQLTAINKTVSTNNTKNYVKVLNFLKTKISKDA